MTRFILIHNRYLQNVLKEAKRVAEDGLTEEERRAHENLENARAARAEKRSRRRARRRRDFFDSDRGSWHQVVDHKTGKLYWHNYVTRKSMWDKPPVLKCEEEKKMMSKVEMEKQQWIEKLASQRKEEKRRSKTEAQHKTSVASSSPPSVLRYDGDDNANNNHHQKRSKKKKTRKKIRIKRLLKGRVSPKAHERFMNNRRNRVSPGRVNDEGSIISSSRRVRKK